MEKQKYLSLTEFFLIFSWQVPEEETIPEIHSSHRDEHSRFEAAM